jgi:hypothetical protein
VEGLAHRIGMRRVLAEHGIPQPAFAAVRTLHEGRRALDTIGLPAVLRADNVHGKAHVFLVESTADLERHLHAALAESATQEAIVESPRGEGTALVAILRPESVDVVEAMPPPGVGWFRPSLLFGDRLAAVEETAARAVRALELAGVACIDLMASTDGVVVLDVHADEPRRELALLLDCAEPTAVRLLTGGSAAVPAGRVRRVGSLDKVLAFPGVVDAVLDVREGDTIVPLRHDLTHGYVLAAAETNLEAVERADAAVRLVDVEVW